jgi:propionyl-CoA carboxylase alpha chain
MFNKILIAGRGEIAARIIRTCKRLGIASVAVYSDADRQSQYWQTADESVYIRGTYDRESSEDLEKIISVAVSANCQAVHPGYGVLSKSAFFAKSLKTAGLFFIGPPADIIALMGDRIAAKELAVKARVPVIPGHVEVLKDGVEAVSVAESIGYPVLLKQVTAGGRNKGMRMVKSQVEMAAALQACCRETRKIFGDNRIFMERYIEQSRHLEIQVLADIHGNVIHLGERDSSIRRRFHKIIEESPSSGVSWELRQRMGKAACTLARTMGYVNAGTVDFLLDAQGGFYFLGMDTGLRAGYLLTEMLTGLDLVELQLRIAFGEPLPFDQAGVVLNGWAMAARICDALPATVIFHGKSRELTRIGLVESLNNYPVKGSVLNINFISSVLGHSEFAKGNLTTAFIENYFNGNQPS